MNPLPCPNDDNHEIHLVGENFESEERIVYSVKCKECGLAGPSDYSQEGALEKWNLVCEYKTS